MKSHFKGIIFPYSLYDRWTHKGWKIQFILSFYERFNLSEFFLSSLSFLSLFTFLYELYLFFIPFSPPQSQLFISPIILYLERIWRDIKLERSNRIDGPKQKKSYQKYFAFVKQCTIEFQLILKFALKNCRCFKKKKTVYLKN